MTRENFHAGEVQLQTAVGVHERMVVAAQHMLHDFMPDQHRDFFAELEYIFLGTAGPDGRPHASLLTGPPGFATSPDPKILTITAHQIGELPGLDNLGVGDAIGVLGIDLSNRRRNRMHGRVTAITAQEIEIIVTQSYGNCPKYINLREISQRLNPVAMSPARQGRTLEQDDLTLIKNADTCFIASYIRDGTGAPYEGADINHRGGRAGFVTVERDNTLIIPDYRGNNLFNTFGNLILNPSAALLFPDFETGDQLHLTGHASLSDDPDTVARFPGALRLLRINVETVERRAAATSLRWSYVGASLNNS